MKRLFTLILILCSLNVLASETPQLTSLWGNIPTAIAKPGDNLHFLSIPTGGSDLEFRFYSSTDDQPNVVLKDWSRDNSLNTTLPISFNSVVYFGEVRGVGQPNSIYASQTYGFIKDIELSATSLFPNESLTIFHPTFSIGNDYHVRFSNPAGFMITVNTVANINGQISVLVPTYINPQTGENEIGRVTVVVDGMRVRNRPMFTIRKDGQIPFADFSINLENGGIIPFQANFDASLSYVPGHENEPDRGITSCTWQLSGGGTGDKRVQIVPGCQYTSTITVKGNYSLTLTVTGINGGSASVTKTFQALENLSPTDMIAISSHGEMTCSLSAEKTVYCWGSTQTSRPKLVNGLNNIEEIAVGYFHACARNTSGEVFCWGQNSLGETGTSPNSGSVPTPTKVANLSPVKSIATGHFHSCAILMDETVQCWGSNQYGELGIGSNISTHIPASVTGLTNVSQITLGWGFTCAIYDTGFVKCWGYGGSGNLGQGVFSDSNVPVNTLDLSNVIKVDSGYDHSCAILQDESVWCWGNNQFGQLGKGTLKKKDTIYPSDNDSRSKRGMGIFENINRPVRATVMPQAKDVFAGFFHSCAIKPDDTVWCWGNNQYKQLGNGTFVNSLQAVQALGISNATQINNGANESYVLLADGSIYAWGSNAQGKLGTERTEATLNPTLVNFNTAPPVADFTINLTNEGVVPFQANFDANISYLPGHENESDRGIASCSWQVLGGGTGDKKKKIVPGCQLSQLISTIGGYTVTLNVSFVNGENRTISKQFQAVADLNRCNGQAGQLQGNTFVANTAVLNTTGILSGKIDICDTATVTGNVSIENFTSTAVKIAGNAQISDSASIRTASGAEVVINGNSIVKGTVKLFSRYVLNITDNSIIEEGAIVSVGQVGGTGSAGEISIKGDSNILGDGLLETIAFNGHKATIIIEDAIINTALSAHAINTDTSISVKGPIEGTITLCANAGQIVTDSNVVISSTPEFCQTNVNIPPIIEFNFSQINQGPPYNFTFDASASSDPDGTIVNYTWHFSDQQTATGKIVNHTFQTPGNHSASLSITDNEGQQSTLTKQFFIEDNSPLYKITVTPFGGIPPYSYLWMNGSTTNSIVIHEGSWGVSVQDSSGEQRSKFIEVGPSKCRLGIDSGSVEPVSIDFTFICENVTKKNAKKFISINE